MLSKENIQRATEAAERRSGEVYKLVINTFEAALEVADQLLQKDYALVAHTHEPITHRSKMETLFEGHSPGVRHWLRRISYPNGKEFMILGFRPYPAAQGQFYVNFYLSVTTTKEGVEVFFGNSGKTIDFVPGDWDTEKRQASLGKLNSLMVSELQRTADMLQAPDMMFWRAMRTFNAIQVDFVPPEAVSPQQKEPIGFRLGSD